MVPASVGVVSVLPSAFDGAIDEVAVFEAALSNGSIYAHFKTAVAEHKPYTFEPVATPAPPPLTANGSYNLSDFHPGTLLPTPEGNSSRWGSKLTLPIEQLKAFPNPRYLTKPASGPTIGTPQKLFNWMDPRYMSGGAYRFFAPPGQLLNISEMADVHLQEELATTWGYNLNMFRLAPASHTAPGGSPLSSVDQALVDLANANPAWGVDTIFQRAGARVCSDYTNKSTCEKAWRFQNQTLADSCYLQDTGAFLTLTGAKVNASNPHSLKVLRPTISAASATANGCPDSLFDDEAAVRGHYHSANCALNLPDRTVFLHCFPTLFGRVQGYQTGGAWKKLGGFKGTVSRINNDGENTEIYMIAATLKPCPFDSDPSMVTDYAKSGIPEQGGKPDWYSFVSRWRTRFSNNLVKKLTDSAESPELKGALFSEYEIQGTSIFFGEWNETRKINTPVRLHPAPTADATQDSVLTVLLVADCQVMNGGKKRYYSTGDFYPWSNKNRHGPTHEQCVIKRTTCAVAHLPAGGPTCLNVTRRNVSTCAWCNVTTCKNISAYLEWGTPAWDGIEGPSRGIDWLAQMLPSQIATGDIVWSPFVAAGWSEMEELNTRPAQWIGQLKLYAVSGAEYFYTGFFNLHPAFPDPRNWVWQGAAPALVQAVTSHYLDVLYEGELLLGDMPVPPLENCFVIGPKSEPMQWVTNQGLANCSGPLPRNPFISYRFWAGSQQVAVMVRALGDKYVVAATVQPQSNLEPAPFSVNANVTLPFGTVTLEIRRQGSVYVIEKSSPRSLQSSQLRRPWTIVQLDGWHESSHFSRWTKNFELEAELHDGHATTRTVAVRTELSPDATHPLDFTASATFVPVAEGGGLAFTVHPRTLSIDAITGAVAAAVDTRRYSVRVKARAASGDVTLTISVGGEPGDALTGTGSIAVAAGPAFAWHRWYNSSSVLGVVELPTASASTVWISAAGGAVDMDAVTLEAV